MLDIVNFLDTAHTCAAGGTADIVLPGALRLSCDQKTANTVDANAMPDMPNAFGIPSGIDYGCPNQTGYCGKHCYAGAIEKLRPKVRELLMHNFALLRDADYATIVALIDDMVTRWEKACDGVPGVWTKGVWRESTRARRRTPVPKLFRIHWDGDMFKPEYTAAWATVVARHPAVQFWVYTRVPGAAMYLHSRKLANLSLYFSADRDNIDIAHAIRGHGIRLAYMGNGFSEGKGAVPGAVPCPENNRKLPIATADGSACATCGLCVFGRRDVLFSIAAGRPKKTRTVAD